MWTWTWGFSMLCVCIFLYQFQTSWAYLSDARQIGLRDLLFFIGLKIFTVLCACDKAFRVLICEGWHVDMRSRSGTVQCWIWMYKIANWIFNAAYLLPFIGIKERVLELHEICTDSVSIRVGLFIRSDSSSWIVNHTPVPVLQIAEDEQLVIILMYVLSKYRSMTEWI